MVPKGALLKPGTLIKVNYARVKFVNKLFRVDQIIQKSDGLINITANEHSDSTFLLEKVAATESKLSGARCIAGTAVTVPSTSSTTFDDL